MDEGWRVERWEEVGGCGFEGDMKVVLDDLERWSVFYEFKH